MSYGLDAEQILLYIVYVLLLADQRKPVDCPISSVLQMTHKGKSRILYDEVSAHAIC